MRPSFSILLALTPLAVTAQVKPAAPATFVVQGSLPSTAARKAYLSYTVAKQPVVDSAEVRGGHFQFKGRVPDLPQAQLILPVPGTVLAKSDERLPLYLEKGVIQVAGAGPVPQATIKGTPLNDESTALAIQMRPVAQQIAALDAAYDALPAAERTAAVEAKHDTQTAALYKQQRQAYATYLNTHPTHLYSLYVLESYVGARPAASAYAALFDKLAPDVRASPYGQVMQQHIKQLQRVDVGAVAPDFSQADPSGKPLKLSDLRGQYVLIDFWASWCRPCREENPNLVKLYTTYKAKGFTVLGVSLDKENQRAAWLKAIESDGLTWPQVSSLTRPNPVAKDYGVNAIPQNFLLDPKGRILAVNVFGKDLAKKLAEVFDKVN
jgi:peroxiredoxin